MDRTQKWGVIWGKHLMTIRRLHPLQRRHAVPLRPLQHFLASVENLLRHGLTRIACQQHATVYAVLVHRAGLTGARPREVREKGKSSVFLHKRK